jgi:SAM-dependent methyltransferase
VLTDPRAARRRIGEAARLLAWARHRGPLRSLRPWSAVDTLVGWARFARDWQSYQRLPGAEPLTLAESWPCIDDLSSTTSFDPQYLYQAVWTGQHVARARPALHVDVGSDHRMVAMLTCVARTAFVDIRPLLADVEGLSCLAGSALALPFRDRSVRSLSCLHVVEHIGLGRYGDPLDPSGSRRAIAELVRVLAPGGCLYFAVPVGRARVQFNGLRVHTPTQLLRYFEELDLVDFTAVDDRGRLIRGADPEVFDRAEYSLGMFRLSRPEAVAS